eukprot:4844596-Amphidinium_carterae.1
MGCCMTLSSPSVPTPTQATMRKLIEGATLFAPVHAAGRASQYLRTGPQPWADPWMVPMPPLLGCPLCLASLPWRLC